MKDKLKEIFLRMPVEKQLALWNEFSFECSWDEYVYPNDPNEFMDGFHPEEIVRLITEGNYNRKDDFVMLRTGDELESFNAERLPEMIDIGELIDWIVEDRTDLVELMTEQQ